MQPRQRQRTADLAAARSARPHSTWGTTSRCTTAAEPADFPRGKLAVVGQTPPATSGSRVLGAGSCTGTAPPYAKIPLPQQLEARRTGNNAIWQRRRRVIVGSNSAVVRGMTRRAELCRPPLTPILGPDWAGVGEIDSAEHGDRGLVLPWQQPSDDRADVSSDGCGWASIAQLRAAAAVIPPAATIDPSGCGVNRSQVSCAFLVTDGGGVAALRR